MIGYGRDDDKTEVDTSHITEVMLKAYQMMPKTAKLLCYNHGGLIVGGYVKYLLGEATDARDLDIVIPLHEWPKACALIPEWARANSFGGFKFKECRRSEEIEIDVWPGDALQVLRNRYHKGVQAYCPSQSLLIKLEVV